MGLLTFPKKILFSLALLIVVSMLAYGIDFLWGPQKAKDVSMPFADGQCLYYENTAVNRKEKTKEEKCFTKLPDGKFKQADKFGENPKTTTITYDKDGFALLTEISDPLLEKVFKGTNVLEQQIINKTKLRNMLYGEPNLQPGTLFHDGYPVKEWTKYNGKPVYLVEQSPHYDLFLIKKGPLLRSIFEFSYKYNKLIYKDKQLPKEEHTATVTRFYYNRSTGILEGQERWQIMYDANWNEIPGRQLLESKSVLIAND